MKDQLQKVKKVLIKFAKRGGKITQEFGVLGNTISFFSRALYIASYEIWIVMLILKFLLYITVLSHLLDFLTNPF